MKSWFYLAAAAAAITLPLRVCAQDYVQTPLPDPVTNSDRWDFFVTESFTPWALLPSTLSAIQTQATASDPKYGVKFSGYLESYGALTVDRFTQKFFSDYVMASVFHEDTRYRRRGPGHGFWSRFGYAVSRSVVTRTDTGEPTFNWANFTGTAFSAGISNLYYPPASRGLRSTAINWGSSSMALGFSNLMPEFLPDFKQWLKRHRL